MGIARYCVSFNFALGCCVCVMSKLLGMTLFSLSCGDVAVTCCCEKEWHGEYIVWTMKKLVKVLGMCVLATDSMLADQVFVYFMCCRLRFLILLMVISVFRSPMLLMGVFSLKRMLFLGCIYLRNKIWN